ncbi:phosphatidate cytidylyltransferase [Arthrobacter crystallopoietes]|uniref:Phosphatidate cytidylyltransferase n=1 Tax=Crystallibacter crystallopoietes TaxID=37928 RepID=A0A1H1H6I1_9MICC|nr:phosphatidate cytidylyltransferase [Arthrobacter crystallopoietes]AUI52137.1 phosphatidate cytidylyltransferase [Arthrobacter crystallopoietes]SDR20708.1 phosphatidate cytidylyltransferase [Arthrobacter crystallopoietes]
MGTDQPSTQAGGSPAPEAGSGSQKAGPGRRALRAAATPSRAGRNLPAAIIVGLALLVAVLVGLFFLPDAFVVLVSVFALIGVWEVSRALTVKSIFVPQVPLYAGAFAMPLAAYYGGPEALAFALVASAVAVMVYKCLDRAQDAVRSIMSGVFVLCWVPLFISFAVLLLDEDNGALKVMTMLLLVVSNDTFGYLVGVLFGKHPMAPKISPKKSWEGFAGSVGGAVVVGILCSVFILDLQWWFGLVLAIATVAASTAGDLAESMVKRELGIKDMSNILPGHGGVMDRLDSIVFAAPVAYVLAVLLAPGAI